MVETESHGAFAISERAAKEIVRLQGERGSSKGALRIAVKGGGCSGLTYALDWAEAARETDTLIERDGARVVIDPRSYEYLAGSELTWQQTLMSSGFKIDNPRVKSSCGCGESFSL